MVWMALVLLYALIKGAREILKKKAMEKNTVMEVLFAYTLFSFILVIPDVRVAGDITNIQLLLVAVKSFIIFLAWMCSFRAIRKLPISLYGVLDMTRVLFAMILGVTVLGEHMSQYQWVGLILVLVGLFLLRIFGSGNKMHEKPATKYVILAFLSCLLNALSGIMDKILMRDMKDGTLQFWYMLFLVLYYVIYIVATKTPMRWKLIFRNYWIYILALIFMIGDRALFIANAYPDSKVTVMTLIKQSSCLFTIAAGKTIFKEKNVTYRFVCALVIVTGIYIATLT